jgi:hypothetical protein
VNLEAFVFLSTVSIVGSLYLKEKQGKILLERELVD